MSFTLGMREARLKLILSQDDLSNLTRINQGILSQIETGRRSPTASQRQKIHAALGPVDFLEKEDLGMTNNVPAIPEMRWNKDGTPDFSHLEDEGGSVRNQLETLIMERNGDGASFKHLTTDHCYFQVVDEDGGRMVYKQSYLVTNGQASLYGDAVEAGEEFVVLSRRRISKRGVPPMPIQDNKGDS